MWTFKERIAKRLKNVYTVEDIAYIYQLNPQKIMDAMAESNINEITSENIKTLFEYIPVQIWE